MPLGAKVLKTFCQYVRPQFMDFCVESLRFSSHLPEVLRGSAPL
jgi:hypothetical protein